jgi:hypothetical protein
MDFLRASSLGAGTTWTPYWPLTQEIFLFGRSTSVGTNVNEVQLRPLPNVPDLKRPNVGGKVFFVFFCRPKLANAQPDITCWQCVGPISLWIIYLPHVVLLRHQCRVDCYWMAWKRKGLFEDLICVSLTDLDRPWPLALLSGLLQITCLTNEQAIVDSARVEWPIVGEKSFLRALFVGAPTDHDHQL